MITPYKVTCFIILWTVLLAPSICSATCGGDSTWEKLSASQKLSSLQTHLSTTTEQCLASALLSFGENENDAGEKKIISTLHEWAATNIVSHQILFAGYSNEFIHKNRTLWQALLTEWERSNKSPYATVVSLINSGSPLVADTLLQILDSEGKINIPELLRWTKIKIITHDYASIPTLYCRIISKKPINSEDSASFLKVKSIALSQFSSQIEEIQGEAADRVLQQFKKCSLQMPDADSLLIRSWLAQAYSRLGMFDRELELLTSIVPSGSAPTLSADLWDIARERFHYHQYIPALRAAKASYLRAQDKEIRAGAASIIYQSFLALGLQDSALIWLKKAEITTENRIVEAIVLYQNSEQVQQSQVFLDKLGPSLVKDTLQIRGFIMSNKFDKAVALLTASPYLKKSSSDMLLWKTRILLFTNKISDLAAILDSTAIPLGHEFTEELLLYKYWLERLRDCPEALEVWSAIEYNEYRGKLEKSVLLSQNEKVDQLCRWRLALIVARAFHEKNKLSAAIDVLNSCDENRVSAEYLYFKAQYLFESGNFDRSKELLQRVVLDYTDEIYSGKARLLLTKMELDQ